MSPTQNLTDANQVVQPKSPFCEENLCNQECVGRYGFNFTYLQGVTARINETCGTPSNPDPRLAYSHNTVISPPALTAKACVIIAGKGGWTPTWYPPSDVWNRLTSWKFPLLQLAAQLPRPPLGKRVEVFVFLHLLGDPIGTLQDLIIKFGSCQSRALFWKHQFSSQFRYFESATPGNPPNFAKFEKLWKAFAIIVDSCDEWGIDHGDHSSQVLRCLLQELDTEESQDQPVDAKALREQLLKICVRTGNALAADRGTKLFPVTVALTIFVAAIAIAFIRTVAAGPDSTTVFINVEAYSVAVSATYFWILSVVIIGSAIGSSQTEDAIPRILKRLEQEVNALLRIQESAEDEWIPLIGKDINEGEESPKSDDRKLNGGIYSWQYNLRRPSKLQSPMDTLKRIRNDITKYSSRPDVGKDFPWILPWNISSLVQAPLYVVFWFSYPIHRLLGPVVPGSPWFPIFVVFTGVLTGWVIGFCIPGEVCSCRFVGEAALFLVFLLNWYAGGIRSNLIGSHAYNAAWYIRATCYVRQCVWSVHGSHHSLSHNANCLLYGYLVKDILSIILTFTGVILIQFGIFNSCRCYTFWNSRHLILPNSPDVSPTLYYRIQTVYPAIAFISIFFQLLIVPVIVFWQYFEALQVFLQRDDDVSKWEWAQSKRDTIRELSVSNKTSERTASTNSSHGDHRAISELISSAVRKTLRTSAPLDTVVLHGQSLPGNVPPVATVDISSLDKKRPLSMTNLYDSIHQEPKSVNFHNDHQSDSVPSALTSVPAKLGSISIRQSTMAASSVASQLQELQSIERRAWTE